MTSTGPRLRRSAARLFVSTALATLMAVTLGGAAQGADAKVAMDDRTDVYIKDIASDVGYEPHGALYTSFFNSPDVKICPDAIECTTHTNPVVGSTSYIFVKLRNPGPYGSGISSGTVRVYYTVSGGSAVWPDHWTEIGAKSIPVMPGVTTVSIPWPNVPSLGHFCLLVRWESQSDPMLFEGSATYINTQFNNNIAWKNANTVPARPGGVQERPFAVANALREPALFDLGIRPVGDVVPEGVRVFADLGPVLFERWVKAGAPGEGIRRVGETEVELDPYRGQIRDLLINPKERPIVKLRFATGKYVEKPAVLQVVQLGPAVDGDQRKFVLGGVDYTLTSAQG
jgi:hypothetical protein